MPTAPPTPPDAPVRDHLRRDFTRLRADWTIGQAVAWPREHPLAVNIVYFYVLDDAGRLEGVAAVLGMTLPILLRLLRLDPRVAAGPIALAGADVITILLYLSLAQWLLP